MIISCSNLSIRIIHYFHPQTNICISSSDPSESTPPSAYFRRDNTSPPPEHSPQLSGYTKTVYAAHTTSLQHPAAHQNPGRSFWLLLPSSSRSYLPSADNPSLYQPITPLHDQRSDSSGYAHRRSLPSDKIHIPSHPGCCMQTIRI